MDTPSTKIKQEENKKAGKGQKQPLGRNTIIYQSRTKGRWPKQQSQAKPQHWTPAAHHSNTIDVNLTRRRIEKCPFTTHPGPGINPFHFGSEKSIKSATGVSVSENVTHLYTSSAKDFTRDTLTGVTYLSKAFKSLQLLSEPRRGKKLLDKSLASQ